MISLEEFKKILYEQSGISASFAEKMYKTLDPKLDWTPENVIKKCPDFEDYWNMCL